MCHATFPNSPSLQAVSAAPMEKCGGKGNVSAPTSPSGIKRSSTVTVSTALTEPKVDTVQPTRIQSKSFASNYIQFTVKDSKYSQLKVITNYDW